MTKYISAAFILALSVSSAMAAETPAETAEGETSEQTEETTTAQ
ncbi:MAG: hypothetical protein ACPGXY_06550 [Alphaproteobacteria bacterium]